MINPQNTQIVPKNIDLFIQEIGAALNTMYGAEAQAAYDKNARAGYEQLFGNPDVTVWTVGEDDPSGLLVSVTRRGVGHITLLHVLENSPDKDVEEALINSAVQEMRGRGLKTIIGEFVRHRPLRLEKAFDELGFTRFNRNLLMANLHDAKLRTDRLTTSVPCGERDSLAAAVLVDAYREHDSRPLHPEALNIENATAFLAGFREGAFGVTAPELYRLRLDGEKCVGFILGAEAAPKVGFIPHVAVARSAQGRGVGADLIREIAAIFFGAGYDRIALGVTSGNPAERLYRKLGFEHLMPVETYAWWENAP